MAEDTTPDVFSFIDQINRPQDTVITSSEITVSGINTAAGISITGGKYSVNGGGYIDTAGMANNGDTVTIQLTSANTDFTTTEAILTIGGVSGTFSVRTNGEDYDPPTISIAFPTAVALTDADTITVRGTADDNDKSGVAYVSINGVDADTTDDFATWSVTVPLSLGTNTLTVEAGDNAFQIDSNAAEVTVERNNDVTSTGVGTGDSFDEPADMVFADTAGHIYVVDGGAALEALIDIDLSNGNRDVVSSAPMTIGTGADMQDPKGVVLDTANNRALVTDDAGDAIIGIDLNAGATFGDRAELADAGTAGYANLRDLVLNGSAVLVVNESTPAGIVSVDPGTPAFTPVSDGSNGSGSSFTGPVSIELDADNNRALVGDSVNNALFSVDLTAGTTYGDRTIIADGTTGTGASLATIGPIALRNSSHVLAATNAATPALLEIDLSTGNRTVVSDSTTGSGPAISDVSGILVDGDNNRAYLLDNSNNSLMTVDLVTGERVISSR